MCNFSSNSVPRLRLRGLCEDSIFDSQYTLDVHTYKDGKHPFKGYYGSEIQWVAKQGHWRMDSWKGLCFLGGVGEMLTHSRVQRLINLEIPEACFLNVLGTS